MSLTVFLKNGDYDSVINNNHLKKTSVKRRKGF